MIFKRQIFIFLLAALIVQIPNHVKAQWPDPIEELRLRINGAEQVPDELLARKSVLLYSSEIKNESLEEIQNTFQKTGIDVVLHFPIDIPTSNEEVNNSFVNYLNSRDIRFLILVYKKSTLLEFIFLPYNRKSSWADQGQLAWVVNGLELKSTLESISRVALASQKKKNFLIIESPEKELNIDPFSGSRNEFFSLDLKVDKLAIIRTGDKNIDQSMEDLFKTSYPFKFTFFEKGSDEQQIRSKGYLYILKYVRCRNIAAMDLLGYDLKDVGHRIRSVSYATGKQDEVSFPADQTVFKFYLKHLTNGNIYLGNKWDVSDDWKEALNNYVSGMRVTFGLKP